MKIKVKAVLVQYSKQGQDLPVTYSIAIAIAYILFLSSISIPMYKILEKRDAREVHMHNAYI